MKSDIEMKHSLSRGELRQQIPPGFSRLKRESDIVISVLKKIIKNSKGIPGLLHK